MVSMVTTQEGVTALYYASQEGHMTVVRLLLENGADVNICDKVVMDFVSCTCTVDIQSVGCMLHMYVCSLQRTDGRLTTQTLLHTCQPSRYGWDGPYITTFT